MSVQPDADEIRFFHKLYFIHMEFCSRMETLGVHYGITAISKWYCQSRKEMLNSTVKRAKNDPRLKRNGAKHSITTTVLRI